MKHAMYWQDYNTKLGFIIGAGTGMIKMMMNIHLQIEFFSKLFESAVTAGVCGFIGVAGKELFVIAKKHLMTYFNSNKKKRNERISQRQRRGKQ